MGLRNRSKEKKHTRFRIIFEVDWEKNREENIQWLSRYLWACIQNFKQHWFTIHHRFMLIPIFYIKWNKKAKSKTNSKQVILSVDRWKQGYILNKLFSYIGGLRRRIFFSLLFVLWWAQYYANIKNQLIIKWIDDTLNMVGNKVLGRSYRIQWTCDLECGSSMLHCGFFSCFKAAVYFPHLRNTTNDNRFFFLLQKITLI